MRQWVNRLFVDILSGARQTVKTAILNKILQPQIRYDLADAKEHSRLLADPGIFFVSVKDCPE